MVGQEYWIKWSVPQPLMVTNRSRLLSVTEYNFQVEEVDTIYTAPPSGTKDMLYADGCTWENNPLSPNYRSCLSTGKYGGDITVTYRVKILSVPTNPLTNPEAFAFFDL